MINISCARFSAFFLCLFLFTSCSHMPDSLRGPWQGLVSDLPELYYDKELSQVDYPFEVSWFEVLFLESSLRMAYMDVASENSRTVVLLHGKNFNGAYWERTANDLAEAGYRVIIPDQIGFGKSSKPLDYLYSFHSLADNTARLLDALEVEEVTLIGHSMGGMLATRFALMFPERVSGLIMANPIGLEDWKRKVPYTPLEQRVQASLNRGRDEIVTYQMAAYYDGNWSDEYESYAAHLIGWAQGPDRAHMAMIDALTVEMVFTQPVLYEFDLVLAPTLLIIGDRDRTALGRSSVDERVAANLGRYDRLGVRTCGNIPRCQLVELEGIGHMPQVEAYGDYIAPILEFLSKY